MIDVKDEDMRAAKNEIALRQAWLSLAAIVYDAGGEVRLSQHASEIAPELTVDWYENPATGEITITAKRKTAAQP